VRKLGVGVIGCGYWGPNIIRNVQRNDEAHVVVACDRELERASRVAGEYRVSTVSDKPDDVLASAEVELVVIATPTSTHHGLAKAAIMAGKHVLAMKPLTDSSEQAEELCVLAQRQGVLLAVDHTFLFTGAVRKMRQLVADGAVGQIHYFDSVRINLGLIQADVNVLWDLAPHDVSIMDFLIRSEPVQVSAVGAAHGGSPTENIAYLTVRYDNSLLGHVHVNWLAPAKIRRTIVGGSKRMLVYDDMEPSEKLRVYDKGFSAEQPAPENGYRLLISYRSGDMHAPRLDSREALAVEVENVVGAIRGREELVADGVSGLRVVRIIEAAQASLREGGTPVRLTPLAMAEW
jgi:predicted dehydrogenase